MSVRVFAAAARMNLPRPVAEEEEALRNPKLAAWAFQSPVWPQAIQRCIELVDSRRQAAGARARNLTSTHADAHTHTHTHRHARINTHTRTHTNTHTKHTQSRTHVLA